MKPLHYVLDRSPGLEILKYEGDRHACALEHPGSAHLARYAFDSRTLRPIESCHAILLSCNLMWVFGGELSTLFHGMTNQNIRAEPATTPPTIISEAPSLSSAPRRASA